MMNLGRAKKKLRYFQPDASTSSKVKITNVFSMRDLDNIFDDLVDSDPGTPIFSPLPKSPRLVEQNKRSQSPVAVSPLLIRRQFSPLKSSDVLAAEPELQVYHLTSNGSPIEEIAPIKTSSPIELLAAEDVEKPETSPLLFGIEEEEPFAGSLSQPQNQGLESSKGAPHEHSESLPSPPVRLTFGKPTKKNNPGTSSTPLIVASQVCKTPASAKEVLQTDGHPSLFPMVIIENHQPEPLPEVQPKKQVKEVAVKVGVKQSLFQKKLRDSLQPKASCFRKRESLKQPARAPSPHVEEEDFLILEDDCPIRFTIPKKTKSKGKTAPESGSVESDLKEKVSPKHTEEVENRRDELKKKTKANDKATRDTAFESAPEEWKYEENKDMEDGEQRCLSSDTNQADDIPVTVKQRPKGKSSKPDQRASEDGNSSGTKILAEKPTTKTKKSAELLGCTNTGQEEPVSDLKKQVKGKSALKEDVPGSKGSNSAPKPKKQDENWSVLKSTKLKKAKVKEQEIEVQNYRTQMSPDPAEHPEVPSTYPVNKTRKESASKKSAPKTSRRVKSKKTKEIFDEPEPDVPAEAPGFRKRVRKPPGEWWLSQNNENDLLEQQEAALSSRELKSNKRTQKKTQVLTHSSEEEVAAVSPEETVSVQKLCRNVKKPQADTPHCNHAGSRKNLKSAGGTWKSKSRVHDQREMTPPMITEEEEEEGDNECLGQPNPGTCSEPPREHSATPGNKRVFHTTYSREGQSRSARKCSPLPLDGVPVKRQRNPVRNWWEYPQSQGPVESSHTPRNSSPQDSRPHMVPPPHGTFRNTAGVPKTVDLGQTPKSVKRSLATLDAIYNSGKPGTSTERRQSLYQKGRRNLLHSLDDQSEQSSENIHNDGQQVNNHATFDVYESGVGSESSTALKKTNPQSSSGTNRASDYALKSGPSSRIDLERYEQDEDVDLPSSPIIPQTRFPPIVMSICDLCGPPLKPTVLDSEDWDNVNIWFSHIWPTTLKGDQGISPDDFHWHCHAGRAMGHMLDLQSRTFSSGKILLGSYMKKPTQTDLNAITVFNVATSCVRVEIDSIKMTYSSGRTFMVPCGQSYSIRNMCQEPAILWYHRILPDHQMN